MEIKSLLAEGNRVIPTKTALRLSLDLQMQIFEKQAEQERNYNELKDRIKKQEDTNIVFLVQNNPKLSLFIFTMYLIVSSLIDLHDVFAQAIGLK